MIPGPKPGPSPQGVPTATTTPALGVPAPASATTPALGTPADGGAAPEEIQRSLRFFEATRTIFETRDSERLPEAIVEAAIRVMDADAVTLLLPRPDGSLAVAHASGMPPEVAPPARIEVGEGIAGRVAQTQQPLMLQGAAQGGHGRARSSIVYPLVFAGRLLGVVTFNRSRPDRPFGQADLGSAGVLASQIMLALRNARLTRQSALAEKLAAVGQLAAGIAHEINTPVQFVGDSVQFVRGAMEDLARLLARFAALRTEVAAGRPVPATLLAEIADLEEEIDLGFISAEVPRALERSVEGIRRVAEIVQAVKTFGRAESRERVLADVNQLLATAAVVARPEYRHIAELKMQLGQLPQLSCHPGDLNQVFLNLVVNAAHAIAEVQKTNPARGTITMRSTVVDGAVLVGVSDTGCGIPASIGDKIFDPFFTTKDVGKGTGLGLSIARTLVVDKHGGSLTYETEIDRGTTFWVRLPLGEP
jgi:signal transduction histidine kinase